MKTFFAQQEVNTGRQIELDLLKSFTIICCLIGAHICDEFIFDFDNSLVWTQSYVFGRVLGAPIFMFSMGFTMMYTTHHTAGDMFWRAIKLLTFGQTLNIFRYAIPYYWGAQLDPAYYNPQQVLNFSSDILQLAGLAFIVMAITRALKLSTALTLLIAIGMSLLGTFLTGVETNNYMVNQALGFLWPTHTESYYPLFNWFIFIAGGQWMGSVYRHINNKKAFFSIAIPIGILTISAYFYLQLYTSQTYLGALGDNLSRYCWLHLGEALFIMSFIPMLIGISYLITTYIQHHLSEEVITHLQFPSCHINKYYSVSWGVITIGSTMFNLHNTSDYMVTWMICTLITSMIVMVYVRHFEEWVDDFVGRYDWIFIMTVFAITLYMAYYAYATCEVMPNFLNNYLDNIKL